MLNLTHRNLALIFCVSLSGCGGGSSGEPAGPQADVGNESPTVLTGVFVDSAVEGVTYSTETQSGTTNVNGEFLYIEGETVVFSIGDLDFASVTGAAKISPVDMSVGTSNPVATATNIARLLQTLDQDGYPYNGITIPARAAESAEPVDFNVSIDAFESNASVINLVANSGALNSSLVSSESANIHLYQIRTLEAYVNQIVGKTLVLQSEDGSRDENNQVFVHADGTATGFGTNGDTNLTWYWDDQFFCRSGTVGDSVRPLDCQVFSIRSGLATVVEARGLGTTRSWFIE